MSTSFLAIDPGLRTGWAALDDGVFSSGEIEGRLDAMRFIRRAGWHYANQGIRLVLHGEAYIITGNTGKKSRQYDPLLILGYMEGVADEFGFEFTSATPSAAKQFGTNKKLKLLGWYTTEGEGHANDAARHLLTCIASRPEGRPYIKRIASA